MPEKLGLASRLQSQKIINQASTEWAMDHAARVSFILC